MYKKQLKFDVDDVAAVTVAVAVAMLICMEVAVLALFRGCIILVRDMSSDGLLQ
jgi:hypothetical protein